MRVDFSPSKWWTNKKLLLLGSLSSVGLVSAGGGLIYFLASGKKYNYDIAYNHSSEIPLISYLKAAEDNQLPMNYKLPSYDQNNSEVYKYLATRVISIAAVSKNTVGTTTNYKVNVGTGFILGKAYDKSKVSTRSSAPQSTTSNDEDHWYYLASNMHVLRSFTDDNSFVQGFYGFSPYLFNKVKENKTPSNDELSNNLKQLESKYQSINSYSDASGSTSHNNYYKFSLDTSWKYLAEDVDFKNKPTTSSDNKQQELSADFGVIRVNLKPSGNQDDYKFGSSSTTYSTPSVTTSNFLTDKPNSNNDYLTQLEQNISTYGDVLFNKESVNSGYLFGYPSVNKDRESEDSDSSQNNQNISFSTLGVNLELKDIKDKTHKQGVDDKSSYPSVDYDIPLLNLLPGASGSPLISFDSSQENQKKFSLAGLYWGAKTQAGKDPKDIVGSVGMITKLIDKDDYDLVSWSGDSSVSGNPRTKYKSLCHAILTNSSTNYTVSVKQHSQTQTRQRSDSQQTTTTSHNITWNIPEYCQQAPEKP